MNGRSRTAYRISHDDRYAIGDHHRKDQARLIGNNCVAIGPQIGGVRGNFAAAQDANHAAVHLRHAHHSIGRGAKRRGGRAPALRIG